MIKYTNELKKLGIGLPEILLPRKGVDLEKWPVVACDQFTSEPEYWEDVSKIVGDNPSTLNLIFPEAYLEDGADEERISLIHKTMDGYLDSGVFEKAQEGAYVVVRHLPGKPSRTGLMINIDLESYDYTPRSTSPIRPTEGTIVSRIPARKRIRTGAPVELPHVMVLLDDPDRTVIEPLADAARGSEPVYSIPLMKNGGSIDTYCVHSPDHLQKLVEAFKKLADVESFKARYGSDNPFYIAIGDGNHSLASAKAYWEDLKTSLSQAELADHPARFAMVEAVNLYDEGISFEPIHRLFFDVKPSDLLESFTMAEGVEFKKLPLQSGVETPGAGEIGFISSGESGIICFSKASASETIASAQKIIDSYLASSDCRIDFVHDLDRVTELGSISGNACCIMPKLKKEEFFGFIVKNGSYPRKSFSMGESNEKRYYMEARIIKNSK